MQPVEALATVEALSLDETSLGQRDKMSLDLPFLHRQRISKLALVCASHETLQIVLGNGEEPH